MLIAARNAFLMGSGGYPIGSVRFFGTSQSYLFHTFEVKNPSVYTVSLWAKTASAITHGCLVKMGRVVRSSSYYGSGFAVGFGNSTFDNSGSKLIALSETITWGPKVTINNLTTWAHYAIVVDDKRIQIYRDGVLTYTWTADNVLYYPWTMYIGGYNDSVAPVQRQLPCYVTRCAMWSRNLSASEIVADYNAASGTPDTNGLTHYWPLSTSDDYLTDRVSSATLTAATDGVEISTDSPFV